MQDQKRQFQYLTTVDDNFTSLTRSLKIGRLSVSTLALDTLPDVDSSPGSCRGLDYSSPPEVPSSQHLCDFSS